MLRNGRSLRSYNDLPGETEAGTAGTQPCRGISRWAHRADVLQRGTLTSRAASLQKHPSDDRPQCLENPRPAGAESTLTENVASPFQAEPRHKFAGVSNSRTVRCITYRRVVRC